MVGKRTEAKLVQEVIQLRRRVAELTAAESQAKKMAEVLLQSEARFTQLVETTGVGVAILDVSGRFTFVNDALCRMVGYAREELQAKAFADLLLPADRDKITGLFWNSFTDPQDLLDLEFRAIHKDGRVIYMRSCPTISRYRGRITAFNAIITDVTAHKKAEKQISKSLKEKEVLLQEIHHRVKNNMQIVSSLLNLQKRTIRDKDARRAIGQSQSRVNTMALVHESLYQAENLSEIEMDRYVPALISALRQLHGGDENVTINVDTEPISLGIDRAVPLSLVLNELISNSLQHAFADRSRRGSIDVVMKRGDEGSVTLTVKDDGQGLPVGLDIGRASTLGLKLVAGLARDQLDGTWSVESQGGTLHTVRFSIR